MYKENRKTRRRRGEERRGEERRRDERRGGERKSGLIRCPDTINYQVGGSSIHNS